VHADLADAAGVPAVLLARDGDGTSRREAYRQFVHESVRPILDQTEEAASDLLEVDVKLSAERLAGADMASRARAFRALTGRDVTLPVEDAREIVGL